MRLAAIILVSILSASCRTVIPRWEGKLYVGDSGNESISRKQSDEVIKCSTPEIDRFICMTGDDFKSFTDTYVLGCKQWSRGTPMMSIRRARAILDAAYQSQGALNTIEPEEISTESENFGEENPQGFE